MKDKRRPANSRRKKVTAKDIATERARKKSSLKEIRQIILTEKQVPQIVDRKHKSIRIRSLLTWFRKRPKKVKFLAVLIAIGGASAVFLLWGMPLPSSLSHEEYPVSTEILDRNGKLLYEIYSKYRRTPVNLSDLPKYIPEATISIEDKEFYYHRGFDLAGMGRALINTVFHGSLQGGSTLTQQLVKNTLLTSERTIRRKAQEAVLTAFVEATYSKDKIIEMYLNQIPYGGAAYGVQAASQIYFGKDAKDLDLAQSAFLAGLIAAPSQYSPYGSHPELGTERQKLVLQRMVEDKYITQDDANEAEKEELTFQPVGDLQAPHFVLWVKDQLVEKYGQQAVEQGGLRVTTTLDLDLQNSAQQIVKEEIDKLKGQKVSNGALIVTRPASGEILAMVGSKDYFSGDIDGKVNVTLSTRQPGSSIKPLNYGLALEDKKITPSTVLLDVPTCFLVQDQQPYCPVNYDGQFHGATQVRFALGNSYNIPAVKALVLNNVDHFIDFAGKMGITTFTDPSKYGLSLTLGGGEVRPIDMAVAFGVFANGGIKEPLVSVLKVTDWKGNTLEETKPHDLDGTRILSPETSYLVSHILLDNNARIAAFGPSSYLVISSHPEASVKTGTTNDRRDNWTIGYTSQAVVTVWVGNNDNTPMAGAVSGVSGASPIWNRTMKAVLDKAEKGFYNKTDDGHAWPHQPDNVIGKLACADTGLLAPGPKENPGCPARFEYYNKENLPAVDSRLRQDIQIDQTNNQMASSATTPDHLTTQNHPVIIDPLGTIYCLDCAFPTTPINIKYPLNLPPTIKPQ